MRKERVVILCAACCALCAPAFAAKAPLWLTDAEAAFPSEAYIRAVGEGETAAAARSGALAGIAAYFSQTVRAESRASSAASSTGGGIAYDESYTRSVTSTTTGSLFSVRYTDAYYSRREKAYSVCAYISRDEAWDRLRPKLDAAARACAERYAAAQDEGEPFRRIIALSAALDGLAGFYPLYDLALGVYPRRCGEYARTAELAERCRHEAGRLGQSVTLSVSAAGEGAGRVAAALSGLLERNGFAVVAAPSAMYAVRAEADGGIQSAGGSFYSYPQVTVTVARGAEVVASYSGRTGRLGAYSRDALERLIPARLERLLEEEFVRECLR